MSAMTFITIVLLFLLAAFCAAGIIAMAIKERSLDPFQSFERQYRMLEFFIHAGKERETPFNLIKGMFKEIRQHPDAKDHEERLSVLEDEFYRKYKQISEL